MTPDQFAGLLRQELARRGGHFDPADVLRFVRAAWPRVVADPDVIRWADEFIDQAPPDIWA